MCPKSLFKKYASDQGDDSHLIFNVPLSKLYTNSLMSSLNSRGGWKFAGSGANESSTGGVITKTRVRYPFARPFTLSSCSLSQTDVVNLGPTGTRPEVN